MIVTAIGLAAILLLAFVISLGVKTNLAAKLTVICLIISGIGGIVLYGYGYAWITGDALEATARATVSTMRMLLAENDYSEISAAPLYQTAAGVVIFWMIHAVAMYTTASAAIITIGADMLQNLRIRMARRGDLVLIYGIQDGSVSFGEELMARKHTSVIFVDERIDGAAAEQIRNFGGVVRNDSLASTADVRFLKKLGVRKGHRKIWLYALAREQSRNLRYAHALLRSLETLEIQPQQTGLVLLHTEEGNQSGLLAQNGQYGYGDLDTLDEAAMVARCLVREYPPVQSLSFNAIGRAEKDLDCLILGFGQIGQAVLRQLVMNGQFAGSQFHATVFDPCYESLNGALLTQNRQLVENYDIRFRDDDARSKPLFDYLDAHSKSLNYIVLCTGEDRQNEEIAHQLLRYFSYHDCSLPVYLCSYSGVQKMTLEDLPQKHELYTVKNLWQSNLDRMAMAVNQTYSGGNGKTMEENWESCDYFSRASSRAFADFIPAMLHIAGKTQEEAAEGQWQLNAEVLESLSMTEHMRWCAFHFAMGYSTMEKETFCQRGEMYALQTAETGKSSLRIGKDPKKRQHACLVSWEELDALSAAENAYTGGNVDYKAKDADNVLSIPEILKIARQAEDR